jgi:hypothetical protein
MICVTATTSSRRTVVLAIDKFNEFNPCQNGGIVGVLHEHGTDSGCGDNN